MKSILLRFTILFAVLCAPARAAHEGRVQILLLGDSTTEGSIPRKVVPEGPHLEDVIRILLAAEGDLPPCDVINLGRSGDFVRQFLDSGRYEKSASKLPGVDYIFIRYGLNDAVKREDWETNFPKDFRELLARLRADHPAAKLIPMTVIPYKNSPRINELIRLLIVEEKLPLCDIHARYAAELELGPDLLNYRRVTLDKIPEKYRELVKPFTLPDKSPTVVVLDNRLDAHFAALEGWFSDRHPNLAGYHVIADETAKYLAPLIRAKFPSPRK